jgi:DNA ligase (NAD+)
MTQIPINLDLNLDLNLAEKNRMEQLVQQLNQYNKAYYIDNKPLITDFEYDELFRQLQALEQAYPHLIQSDSPTQNVANQAIDKRFTPVAHIQPMLSLNNALSMSELAHFVQQCSKITCIDASKLIFNCEPKFDGLALSLHYQQGKLICAATRGDGKVGENVTHNVQTMACIPKFLHGDAFHIPDFIEIRGEVLIFNQDFIQLNQNQAAKGKRIYVNPRNAAAGSLRQLNAEDTANIPLSFFAYGIGDIQLNPSNEKYAKNLNLNNQSDIIQQLIAWGMPVAQQYIQTVEGIAELENYYTHIQNQRDKLDFDIDGVVYKINNIELQQKMGYCT